MKLDKHQLVERRIFCFILKHADFYFPMKTEKFLGWGFFSETLQAKSSPGIFSACLLNIFSNLSILRSLKKKTL